MSNTLEHMKRKIASAEQLESVVRTMKAQAASSIVQYQTAVASLVDYCHAIDLGLIACFGYTPPIAKNTQQKPKHVTAIVFGSDQGLVGQFNEQVADYMRSKLDKISGTKTIISVGERADECLRDIGFGIDKTYEVPNIISAITPLVGQILTDISAYPSDDHSLIIFYNQSVLDISYKTTHQQLLPFDTLWQETLTQSTWPTHNVPEIIGGKTKMTLSALIHEHLFISLFRACAESLTCENASRLAAMQRAEKNIAEMLKELKQKSRSIRQNSIDEELFDVIASYKFGK